MSPFLWESNTSNMIMFRIMTTIVAIIAKRPPTTPPIEILLLIDDREPA